MAAASLGERPLEDLAGKVGKELGQCAAKLAAAPTGQRDGPVVRTTQRTGDELLQSLATVIGDELQAGGAPPGRGYDPQDLDRKAAQIVVALAQELCYFADQVRCLEQHRSVQQRTDRPPQHGNGRPQTAGSAS
jgi:hypothetical protein